MEQERKFLKFAEDIRRGRGCNRNGARRVRGDISAVPNREPLDDDEEVPDLVDSESCSSDPDDSAFLPSNTK